MVAFSNRPLSFDLSTTQRHRLECNVRFTLQSAIHRRLPNDTRPILLDAHRTRLQRRIASCQSQRIMDARADRYDSAADGYDSAEYGQGQQPHGQLPRDAGKGRGTSGHDSHEGQG